MRQYAWPGNIRELRNVAERSMIVCRDNRIELDDLHLENSGVFTARHPSGGTVGSLKMLMEKTERQAIVDALEKSGGNRAEAAKQLGIHRTGLYQKMKKYDIS
jgi:transcriptional regulator with PAS, ATPase and Fis domain